MSFMKLARRRKDLGITGAMAKWYDRNSRETRQEEMRGYASEVAGRIKPGASVLEVAPGPGLLSIALSQMGNYRVTGMDISPDFIRIATENAQQAGAHVNFREGNVSSMPFADGQFDFVVCTAAFKNFKEPLKVLNEMYRVLKPGGEALIIDMNHNATREQQNAEIAKMNAKGFDRWFLLLSFHTFLKQGAYTSDEFEELLARTAFANHHVKEKGISLYVNCHKGDIK